MKKLVSIFAIVLGALAISSTNALAHLTASDLELLRGLDGFQLMVERIKPEIERDGLFRSTLREDMELRLRIGGVRSFQRKRPKTNRTPRSLSACGCVEMLARLRLQYSAVPDGTGQSGSHQC